MFDYFKKIAISNRADDELLYEYVLTEMETGTVSKGLWGKALSDSNGDDAKAESIYMKYRVQSIKDVFASQEIAYNEFTKPNLFEYIQNKIFPTTKDYMNLTGATTIQETTNYHVSKDEEAIYDVVAQELASNIRKEGLWLKSIQNTNGDENKTLALYIKYRSEAIKTEKQEILQTQKLENEKLEKRKKAIKEAEEAKIRNELKENNMYVFNQISPLKVKANYNNSPIDVNLEYKNDKWQITD